MKLSHVDRSAFTLIELLVVIAIIAILASHVETRYFGWIETNLNEVRSSFVMSAFRVCVKKSYLQIRLMSGNDGTGTIAGFYQDNSGFQ